MAWLAIFALGNASGYGIAASQASSSPAPSDMVSTMSAMTSNLANREGSDFEHEFLTQMIQHHNAAVAMATMVLLKSARPELRQLANDIIAAQNREVQMMSAWNSEWFGTANEKPHVDHAVQILEH